MSGKQKLVKLSSGVAGALILFVIIIVINALAGSFHLRKDMTQERLYTLSDGTRKLLSQVDKEVTLHFFFNKSSRETPVYLKMFASRVQDLLHEFTLASGGKVRIRTYDPEPDSDAEEWAQKFGISGPQISPFAPTIYLGLAATCGDRQAAIPALYPQMERMMEYNLIRMIHRVSHPDKQVLGVMSSLPVLGHEALPFAMPGQPPQQSAPPWAAFGELRQDYEVRDVPTSADAIPQEITALIVVHPKDLAPKTQYALDQFLLRGGRLMVFVDPLCIADNEGGPMQMQSRPASDLPTLFSSWGVTYNAQEILADLGAATRLPQRGDDPTVLSMNSDKNVNKQDIVTADLRSLFLVFTGAFDVQAKEGVTATTLLHSSPDSDMVNSYTVQMGGDAIRRGFVSDKRERAVAVRLHGKFKSAFPAGKPKDVKPPSEEPDAAKPDEASAADVPPLAQSAADGTVILVGDVDMLTDRFSVEPVQTLFGQSYEPKNNNIHFLAGAVEQLCGSSELIGIRTRGAVQRPFTKVDDMESKVALSLIQEEKRLQEKLDEANRQIQELQQQKAGDKGRISQEQLVAIKRFQEERVKTRIQLRDVRKKVRSDIDELGAKLKRRNILWMPILVALAGVGFGVYRRSRIK